MIRLTKSQILLLHEQLITETGGSSGLRDEGMLDSALNAPFQTFGKEDMYPSLQQKAARLCFGLVKNHPFVDGNKRIGAHAMLVFLAKPAVRQPGGGGSGVRTGVFRFSWHRLTSLSRHKESPTGLLP